MRNTSPILHAREADTLPVFAASEAIMELPTRHPQTEFFRKPFRYERQPRNVNVMAPGSQRRLRNHIL